MTHVEKVTLTLQFYIDMPDDGQEADDLADRIGDALGLMVCSVVPEAIDDSASVIDWTSETE